MEDVAKVAANYFESLFNAGTCHQIDDCLNMVTHKVTPNMQQLFSSDFTVDDLTFL